MYKSRLDEIQKELHEKVLVNLLVKLFESEETNRTFTFFITPISKLSKKCYNQIIHYPIVGAKNPLARTFWHPLLKRK